MSGENAAYDVEVAKTGTYSVTLEWIQSPPAGCTLEARFPDEKTSGITDGGKTTDLGIFTIKRDRGELILKLTGNAATVKSPAQLRFIQLRKIQ